MKLILLLLIFSVSAQAQQAVGTIPLSLVIENIDFEKGFVNNKGQFTDKLQIQSEVLVEAVEKTGIIRITFPEPQRIRPANIDIGQMYSARQVQYLDINIGAKKESFLELVSKMNQNALIVEQTRSERTYHKVHEVVFNAQVEGFGNNSELNLENLRLNLNEVHYRNGGFEIDMRARRGEWFPLQKISYVLLSDPESRAVIEAYETQRLKPGRVSSAFNRLIKGTGLLKENLVPLNIPGPTCSRLF